MRAATRIFVQYLAIPAVPGAGELMIFCAALVGAGLGFLWFNTYPAQVFMGDIGALALGAALGVDRRDRPAGNRGAHHGRHLRGRDRVGDPAGGLVQDSRGKRIFRMAPIHHHFELKGWAEPKVIVRFWIITFILVLAGLATLKLR